MNLKLILNQYLLMQGADMNKKFKFTTSSLSNLSRHSYSSKSTELEFSDTEVIGLRCLVGRTGNKRFLLRYTSPVTRKKASIGLGSYQSG